MQEPSKGEKKANSESSCAPGSNAAPGVKGHHGATLRRSHQMGERKPLHLLWCLYRWKLKTKRRKKGAFRVERQSLNNQHSALASLPVCTHTVSPSITLLLPISAWSARLFKYNLLSRIFSNLSPNNYLRQHLSSPGVLQMLPLQSFFVS